MNELIICISYSEVYKFCKARRQNCRSVQFKGKKLRSEELSLNRASTSSESDWARVEEAGSTEWHERKGQLLSQTAAWESKTLMNLKSVAGQLVRSQSKDWLVKKKKKSFLNYLFIFFGWSFWHMLIPEAPVSSELSGRPGSSSSPGWFYLLTSELNGDPGEKPPQLAGMFSQRRRAEVHL